MGDALRLRIVVVRPPPGVDYGLQRGRGSGYETVQTQRSRGADLTFELSIDVRPGPRFGGPFVQGKPAAPFVYLDIGTYAGQTGTPWSRRLKVPLERFPNIVAIAAACAKLAAFEKALPENQPDAE